MNTCVAHFTWAWSQEQGKAAHWDRVIPCESICFIYLSKHVKVEVYRDNTTMDYHLFSSAITFFLFTLDVYISVFVLIWPFSISRVFIPILQINFYIRFSFYYLFFLSFPYGCCCRSLLHFLFLFLSTVSKKNWKSPLRISQPLCSKKKHGIFTINNLYVLMQRPERMMRHKYGV